MKSITIRHLWWYIWPALLLLMIAAAIDCAFFIYWHTPFAASVDTTSLQFTTTGDPTQDPDFRQLGLFASTDHVLDIDVSGCDFLQSVETVRRETVPCGDQYLRLKHVQLTKVSLGAETRVSVSLGNGTLIIKLDLPQDSQTGLFVSTSPDHLSQFGSTPQTNLGQWRIQPSGRSLTLTLRENDSSRIWLEEEDIVLTQNASVLFETEHGTAIVGDSNLLVLPELPQELANVKLGNGTLRVEDLRQGRIRHLSLKRNSAGPFAMHVELTGEAKGLFIYDTYSASERNEALTWFDANSGKDRKLKAVAICLLVIGFISIVYNLAGAVWYILEIRKKWDEWLAK